MKKMVKNWLLIISIFLCGCVHTQLPKDVLPKEEFVKILIAFEAAKQNTQSQEIVLDSVSIFNNILHQYGVSDTTYQKTLLFYIKTPEDMLAIVKEVEVYLD